MSRFFNRIYGLPLYKVNVIILLSIILWGLLSATVLYFGHRKFWRLVNIFLFIAEIFAVLSGTLLLRKSAEATVQLIPFYSFVEAKVQPEFYRTMLMNILFFLPFGLTLPFILPKTIVHKILFSVISAFIFSVVIEFLQYYFLLGRTETDDVICNTFGALLGTLSFCLSKWMNIGKLKNLWKNCIILMKNK